MRTWLRHAAMRLQLTRVKEVGFYSFQLHAENALRYSGGHGLLVAAASPPLAVLYRADLDALRLGAASSEFAFLIAVLLCRQELLSGLTGPEAAERLRHLRRSRGPTLCRTLQYLTGNLKSALLKLIF